MSILVTELKAFNNNLKLNQCKNITFDEVMIKIDQTNLLCNPKNTSIISSIAENNNKNVYIENKKYQWNFSKYLYIENYNAYTNSKKDRKEIKEICCKISKKLSHYFYNLNCN